MIPLTDEEYKSYENQKRCYLCQKRFTKHNKRVRDHCHCTGKFRGASRNKYNMNYKITKDVTVIFPNASTYDFHNQRTCQRI